MPGDPLLDKVPPHSVEAEMSVLGAMLLSTEATGIVVQHVDEDCFYLPQHRTLFKVLVEFYDANKPVDLVLVTEALRAKGKLEEVGGDAYLITLADVDPTVANAEYYAKVVKDKALLQGLIQAGAEIIRDGHSTDDSVEDILRPLRETHLRDHRTQDRQPGQRRPLHPRPGHAHPGLRQGGRAITGLETGLHDLDGMTRGLQPSEMIVLAARPSVGKSALALNIAEHVAADLEAARRLLQPGNEQGGTGPAAPVVAGQRRRPETPQRHALRKPRPTPSRRSRTSCTGVPLYIDDSPGMRVLDLRAKARRLYLRHEIKLIIVDYLQLMTSPGSESRQVEVANISRGLKALARELKVPVLAVAQLRRPAPNMPRDAAPQLSDLRESGAIEQDADVVMLLDRAATRMKPDNSEEYRAALGMAELYLAKQRNGPTGLVKLTWLRHFTRFASYTEEVVPHEAPAQDGAPPPSRQARPVQANLAQMGDEQADAVQNADEPY